MDHKSLMKEARHQILYIILFYLYEMFRRGKVKETEIRLTFNCETGYNQIQQNCWASGNILKVDHGSFKTLYIFKVVNKLKFIELTK